MLIADDDRSTRTLVEQCLTGWGYDVVSAGDGAEALELFAAEEFSLVISDWMMPGIDGLELVRRIRALERPWYVYIVLLTAKSRKEDIVRGMEAGADEFLIKPFDLNELRARLRAAERILRLEQDLTDRNRQLEAVNDEISKTNRRMKLDLEAGARVQQALLPARSPVIEGFRFAWRVAPCEELAGDILNVFPLDEDHVGVYVLDVSGHGVSAALLSVTVSRQLSAPPEPSSMLARSGPGSSGLSLTPPAEVATELNRRFPWDPQTRQFFTLVYGILNARTGEFRFVTAGHPGPIVTTTSGDPVTYDHSSFPIGMIPSADYHEQRLVLKPGDRLFLYTDGFPDAYNPAHEFFSVGRLMESLDAAREVALEEGVASVFDRLQRWSEPERLSDDVSLLAIEFAGAGVDRSPHVAGRSF